jgi:predicted nucleic acid-binding protein
MKKLAIYLDTSVLNFLFADDAPEKRDITREFFEQLKEKKHDAYVSDVVVDEISKADPDKRDALLKIIADY